ADGRWVSRSLLPPFPGAPHGRHASLGGSGREISPLEGSSMKRVLWALPLAAVAISAGAVASAQPHNGPVLAGLDSANTRSPGFAPASRLSPQLSQSVVAQGSMKLENPTAQIA